jgi:hypothetical protein
MTTSSSRSVKADSSCRLLFILTPLDFIPLEPA